ncbi:hypothetical protein LWC33_11795 [Pseudonocardia sp. RS11V-5]|uniref:hypothetical protein n=1 Tax=Pseudonocardia terrae TaxID=2905831 RepID=UPI001E60CD41|nr:hypothetical protein [Pseudonocardia terrae]MCE3552140.1 hypothetical protein [Pseudonocardia terrae]
MTGPDCTRCRGYAPELALGLLGGHERAEALAHLERCPPCRDEVSRLVGLHDRLRALVPPVEPPAGFEERVLRRIGPVRPRPRLPGWGRVAAAAVLVVAAFAGGWLTGTTTATTAPSAPMVAAPLLMGDRHVGDVLVSRARPDFLSVYLDVEQPGRLTCDLLRKDGTVAATAVYDASGDGTEWWGVESPTDAVASVRIADAAGGVVASGEVPRP